jgi:hypothetical protein
MRRNSKFLSVGAVTGLGGLAAAALALGPHAPVGSERPAAEPPVEVRTVIIRRTIRRTIHRREAAPGGASVAAPPAVPGPAPPTRAAVSYGFGARAHVVYAPAQSPAPPARRAPARRAPSDSRSIDAQKDALDRQKDGASDAQQRAIDARKVALDRQRDGRPSGPVAGG